MSFTVYYTTSRPVTPQEADAIRSAAMRDCKGYSWLNSEPINFFPDLQDDMLMGGSKPNFSPHQDERLAAQASGLPDGGPRDLLEILARISRDFKIDWDIMHDYGPMGCIKEGLVDPQTMAQIEALGGLSGLM